MKKTILGALVASVLSIGSVNAATFDFIDLIDNTSHGEKGYTNDSPFTWTQDNLTLTATASYQGSMDDVFVYMDKGDAGMGICHSGLSSSLQCTTSSDDNVSQDEVLFWQFDKNVTEVSLYLQDANHNAFNDAFEYFDYSSSQWVQAITQNSRVTLSLNGVSQIDFRTINDDKFYIGEATVSAVPEPSTYALMIAGLGLVGFMASRRKKA